MERPVLRACLARPAILESLPHLVRILSVSIPLRDKYLFRQFGTSGKWSRRILTLPVGELWLIDLQDIDRSSTMGSCQYHIRGDPNLIADPGRGTCKRTCADRLS